MSVVPFKLRTYNADLLLIFTRALPISSLTVTKSWKRDARFLAEMDSTPLQSLLNVLSKIAKFPGVQAKLPVKSQSIIVS